MDRVRDRCVLQSHTVSMADNDRRRLCSLAFDGLPVSSEGQEEESDGSSIDRQEVERGAMASSSSNT